MFRLRGAGWGVLVLTAVLAAAPAHAEEEDPYKLSEGFEGYMTFGGAGIFTDDESFKLGEYNGLTGNEGYFFGETDLFYNRGGHYFDLSARNLGLESREVYLESGRYGSYSVFAEYNQGPHLINGVNQTVFRNPGSSSLVLNPGFAQGDTTGAMTFGNRGRGLGIRRDAARFGFESLFKDFNYGITYERREMDGVMSLGGPLGDSFGAGNVRSVVLPDPVDSVTNEMHGKMEYTGDSSQYRMYFDLSWFDNKIENLAFQNPFNTAGHPANGLISRAPDNQHFRGGIAGGYNFSDRTRLSGALEYGVMRQNEPLVPFSVGTGSNLLPRTSADAEIHTFLTTFNLSHRPTNKLSTNLRYRHYQTINQTPQQFFNYVVNDTGGQVGVADSLANLPFDSMQDRVNLDVSYYLLKGTTLKAGYEWERMERSFREVETVMENTITAGFKSGYFENVIAGYTFTYSRREENDPYLNTNVFNARHHPTSGSNPDLILNPDMRRYDIAGRKRFRHDVNLSYFPNNRIDLGFFYNFMRDQYDSAFLGMESFQQHAFTFDAGYLLTRKTRFNFYYTLELIETVQNNRSYNQFIAGSVNDPARNWSAVQDNVVHTYGAGLNYRAIQDRLNLNVDFWYSDSEENFAFRAGSALGTPQSLPALITRTQNADVKGTYAVRKNFDVGLRYLFQKFETDDFATDFFQPSSAQINNVLTLSGTVQDYEAHTGMLFFTYRMGE